jgi:MoaA/NifB/PqqE/SkfB family radical SAM enzyme
MFIDLKRVEFIITYACSGECKHCSIGDRIKYMASQHIVYEKIRGSITKLSAQYNIESIMCFGGEPLLYAEDVCNIIEEAKACNIAKRQIITNGYFHKSEKVIDNVVNGIEEAGVTELLLSVDAFHQETIPIEPVYTFAKAVKEGGRILIKVHPAWVVDMKHTNKWNTKTSELLSLFDTIPISSGNNIFPSGNATRYLAEYYPATEIDLDFHCGQAPYTSELDKVDTISIEPDGTVSVCGIPIGNCYSEDILAIMKRYNPYEHHIAKHLIEGGIKGLIGYANTKGISMDTKQYHSPCSICKELVRKLVHI